MNDYLKSVIRTAVPIGLGILATWLVTAVARWAGVELDGRLALAIVTGLTITLVYAIGRAAEHSSTPLIAWVGRFLLSLGADLGTPTYIPPDPTAVRPLSKPVSWQ